MSNARIIQLADAIVLYLNEEAATLGTTGTTAVRSYLPRYELKDMDTLHLTVVPRTAAQQKAGRRNVQEDLAIDVAVQKRFTEATKTEEIDALVHIVQTIFDSFVDMQIGDYSAIVVVNDPIYSPEHFEKFQQFTSVITVSFQMTT